MSGFLEIKQNKTINYLKALFGKNSIWENRYITIKGTKMYIYLGQKYNKPTSVINLTEELVIKEVRKADIGGKENVFSLSPGPN